jgi:hypothetical protein
MPCRQDGAGKMFCRAALMGAPGKQSNFKSKLESAICKFLLLRAVRG